MTSRTELRILTALRSMQPLQGMETHHLKKLASIAREVTFDEGEIIYREGDIGKAIYLIEEGQVAIEMSLPEGGQVPVLTLGPGELFGWSALFPPQRKRARARAVTPTRVIAIDADRLRDLFQSDHTLEYILMKRIAEVVAERVKATRQQLVQTLAPGSKK